MSGAVLPNDLRSKIRKLSGDGLSTIEIFDLVFDEAIGHVNSNEQLTKCISTIRARKSPNKQNPDLKQRNKQIPNPKHFDNQKHLQIIDSLTENMNGKIFENSCEKIIVDILENYEDFKDIESANKASGFTNPPFDFFGLKNGNPYVIEFKGSLDNFNSPGETQKRRLNELLKRIEGLNIALVQVKLKQAEYRIFYNEQVNIFFDGKQMPLEPVEAWLRLRIDKK
ncbi:MAG: hypothetical protein ACQ9MH_19335 [Nitrospinales bacterium]